MVYLRQSQSCGAIVSGAVLKFEGLLIMQAEADAVAAAQLLPAWPKPRYTLAQAYMSISDHHAAVQACRQGEALYDSKSNLTNDFSQLLDTIAMSAALSGDLSGFDGRHLEVSLV